VTACEWPRSTNSGSGGARGVAVVASWCAAIIAAVCIAPVVIRAAARSDFGRAADALSTCFCAHGSLVPRRLSSQRCDVRARSWECRTNNLHGCRLKKAWQKRGTASGCKTLASGIRIIISTKYSNHRFFFLFFLRLFPSDSSSSSSSQSTRSETPGALSSATGSGSPARIASRTAVALSRTASSADSRSA